jgi:hypothetical protein
MWNVFHSGLGKNNPLRENYFGRRTGFGRNRRVPARVYSAASSSMAAGQLESLKGIQNDCGQMLVCPMNDCMECVLLRVGLVSAQ